VERLTRGHRVDALGRERNRLGGAEDSLCRRRRRPQLREHRRARIDRDHGQLRVEQHPRELSGAGPEVEDDRARAEIQLRDRLRDHVSCVPGPTVLVLGRHASECACGSIDLDHGRGGYPLETDSVAQPALNTFACTVVPASSFISSARVCR
jgi:hypothetical protein